MTRRDLEARYANTRHWPLPPSDVPGGTCECGAIYMDNEPGHDSHELVFGHRPRGPTTHPRQNDVPLPDEGK